MSVSPGTAGRLVARAGRAAVPRRAAGGLVELEVPATAETVREPASPAPAAAPAFTRPLPALDLAHLAAPKRARSVPAPAATPTLETPRRRPEPPQVAAEHRPADAAPERVVAKPTPAPVEPVQPAGPARTAAGPLPPPESPRLVPEASSLPEAAAATGSAAGPAGPRPAPVAAPSPHPAPVVIDRIEIVTPPAALPPPDRLASVAARRAGTSRHGGTR